MKTTEQTQEQPTKRAKTGGRQKGTPNKTTVKNRDWISDVLRKNRKKLETELKQLRGRDFVVLYEKFFSYITPKITVESLNFDKLTDTQLDDLINKITEGIDTETDTDTEQTDTEQDETTAPEFDTDEPETDTKSNIRQ